MDLLDSVSVAFSEEFGGTYVVRLNVGDTVFEVSCQHGLTHSHKESSRLESLNQSGGDYYDSGAHAFIDERFNDDVHRQIQAMIEKCAEEQLPENTVVQYIFDEENINAVYEKSLFGANYDNNCGIHKYTEENGEKVIIVAIDDDEPLISNGVQKCVVFNNYSDYEEWFDLSHHGNESEVYLHHGDCSLAFRAFNNL